MTQKGTPTRANSVRQTEKSEQPAEKTGVEQLNPEALQSLQRAVGNQAMNRLLRREKKGAVLQTKPAAGTENDPHAYMGPGRYHAGADSGQRLGALELTHSAGQQQVARAPLQTVQPRLVKTISVINRAVVQRVPANLAAPTTDLTHPALTGLGITKLGPYKFYPMTGKFKYEPPDEGLGVKRFLVRLLEDKTAGPHYQPEGAGIQMGANPKWTNPANQAEIAIHPADPQERIDEATDLYNTTSFKQGQQTNVVGKVLDALKSHDDGKTPRSFHNINQEDQFGAAANAHIRARHVLGGEMRDEEDVAIRAAFGLVGGMNGKKAMYSKTASAFRTVADANQEIGMSIRDELFTDWKKYREELVINGIVNLKVARHGGQIVAYQSTTGKKYADAEKPAYLPNGGPGHKPLYYPDQRWDGWAATSNLTDPEKLAARGAPLTQEVSASMTQVQVRILSSADPAHGGWFVHSAYPIF